MAVNQRSQAIVFILLTFLASWTQEYFIIRGGSIQNPASAFALMWTPGLTGILCSMIFGFRFHGLALKIPHIKWLGLAYLIPALAAILIVVVLCRFSFATFQVSPQLVEKKGSLGGALLAALVMAPTLGMILPIISGLGEEIGWRGFLHSRLSDLPSGVRYLVTGINWSIWHWPLIIFGDYATSDRPWLNVIFFTIAVTSLSFYMGFLRDRSKSVFPPALVHATHNMWVLGLAPVFFKSGPLVPYLGGESGAICAMLYLGLAAVIYF